MSDVKTFCKFTGLEKFRPIRVTDLKVTDLEESRPTRAASRYDRMRERLADTTSQLLNHSASLMAGATGGVRTPSLGRHSQDAFKSMSRGNSVDVMRRTSWGDHTIERASSWMKYGKDLKTFQQELKDMAGRSADHVIDESPS